MRLSEAATVTILQTAFLGDVALAVPLVGAVRRAAPDVRLRFVTTPAAAPLLQAVPAIDEVIAYDKRKTERGWAGIRRLAERLRVPGMHVMLGAHRSMRSTLLASMSRPSFAVGYRNAALSFLYSRRLRYPGELPETRRVLELLTPFDDARHLIDLHPSTLIPEIRIQDSERAALDAIRAEYQLRDRAYVLVAPGSVCGPTKRWKPAHFAELCRILSARGLQPLLIGSPGESTLCAEIAQRSGAHDISGRTGLAGTVELARGAAALVSNDSAPAHLGFLAGTPVAAIFGPTHPIFGFAPQGAADMVYQRQDLACRPCAIHGSRRCPLGTHACMEGLEPETVADGLFEQIRRNP